MLAVVRSLGSARRLGSPQEVEDFEQELVDQFGLALASSGVTDGSIASVRSAVFEFVRFLGQPLWTATAVDADRFLAGQRKRGLARSTVYQKAGTLAGFFDFLLARYQGDIHALTGHVITQPIDEFNRPSSVDSGALRVPRMKAGAGAGPYRRCEQTLMGETWQQANRATVLSDGALT